MEQAQNSGLKQVEAVIGVEGSSSVVGTLEYYIKSPASDGGGHVQGVNKGGTGQTSYTKGDILIATSSSVLTKLAVGANGTGLVADSTQATGIGYQGLATATNLQNQTNTYGVASVLSASVWGVNFPTAVSVLVAGQSFAIKFPTSNSSSTIALQVSSLLALRIKNPDLTNPAVGDITPSMIGILESDGTNYQLVTRTKLPTNTNGTATKDASDASTTQNIAHGLGVEPKKVRITALCPGASTAGLQLEAFTVYNGTTQSSVSLRRSGTTTNEVLTTFALNDAVGGGGTQAGVVTFDATNIIITWTKTSSPTGSYTLLWEAQS